ncbi:FliO/MopB family protein [Marinagarivorans algicola]|uniref:FliO/MopB family protein n=1 Tax=Marinagarivorans algicola TaxID=1513270 RepID=UPI0037358D1D
MSSKKSVFTYSMGYFFNFYCLAVSPLMLAQDHSTSLDDAAITTPDTVFNQTIKSTQLVPMLQSKYISQPIANLQTVAPTPISSVAPTSSNASIDSTSASDSSLSGSHSGGHVGYSRRESYASISKAELLMKVVLGLVFVLGVIGLLAWLSKKTGIYRLANHKKICLRESVNLSNKEKLILVDFAGESLLLGVGGGRITLIKSIPELPTAKAESVKTSLGANNALDFQHKLNSFLLKGGQS